MNLLSIEIEDYALVTATDDKVLSKSVYDLMRLNFVPLGGISTAFNDVNRRITYCQAMIRYKKVENV